MTIREVSERYRIPMEVLREYERWTAAEGIGPREYGDRDLERLGLLLTLYDIGFTRGEAERYLRLLLERPDAAGDRLRMLERRRCAALEEIHRREKQVERLDVLRRQIQKSRKRGRGGQSSGAPEKKKEAEA